MIKKKVLFVCKHNSARSQMAEGILRKIAGDRFEVHSAGSEPSGVHPLSIKVMNEIGIDISDARSKNIEDFLTTPLDYVIMVCGGPACPFFPSSGKIIHKKFLDPSSYYGEDRLEFFRKVRDEIFSWIEKAFLALTEGEEDAQS